MIYDRSTCGHELMRRLPHTTKPHRRLDVCVNDGSSLPAPARNNVRPPQIVVFPSRLRSRSAKFPTHCPRRNSSSAIDSGAPVFNEMHPRDAKFAKAFPVATLLKLGKALPIIKAELASAISVGSRNKPSKVWVVAAFGHGNGIVAKGLGRTFTSALSASLTHMAFHLMRKHVEGDIGKRIKLFELAIHEFANDQVLSACSNYFHCRSPSSFQSSSSGYTCKRFPAVPKCAQEARLAQ
ncbi:hypothetical protein BCR44DRAFT_200203 [Catenaria anguillulae PL171]|uniref:Uncharacterized protein n=1 Tax=Catenaria anguillulae PL171 TaxID=765915 RepID=A0A1Y2I3S1_9FUNG|nr:hypothetical protein BCR44DRAFT_200203 [Catenaria anguillulae PL171]